MTPPREYKEEGNEHEELRHQGNAETNIGKESAVGNRPDRD